MIFKLIFTVVCQTQTFEAKQFFNSLDEAKEELAYVIENPLEDPRNKDPRQCKKLDPRIEKVSLRR